MAAKQGNYVRADPAPPGLVGLWNKGKADGGPAKDKGRDPPRADPDSCFPLS